MGEVAEAVAIAAGKVHVPGTPLSLCLDGVESSDRECTLSWSYRDPTGETSDGRVRGETTIDIADLPDGDVGESCWATAQLAAAHRWVYELDGDEMPGVPYTPRTWTVDEAWQALLVLLGRFGAVSQTGDGEITVRNGDRPEVVLRLDPAQWAAHVALRQR